MNWQKYSAIAAILSTIIGGTIWFATHVVFAEDFNQYQGTQELKWAESDADRLWIQYGDAQRYADSPLKKQRMADLERRIQQKNGEIKSLRESN